VSFKRTGGDHLSLYTMVCLTMLDHAVTLLSQEGLYFNTC
jgi:hypothetical protein